VGEGVAGGDGRNVSSSLLAAGGAAAGAASSAGISAAGDAGRFSIAILGEGNTGRHYSPGLIMAARARSIFIRLAERLHQLKGDITVRTGVFIYGHFQAPILILRPLSSPGQFD